MSQCPFYLTFSYNCGRKGSKTANKANTFHIQSKIGLLAICKTPSAFVSSLWLKKKSHPSASLLCLIFRTQEAEKVDKKPGKKRKLKKKERLEEEIEEEAGEEVEGGWEKVKGGAPLVKVKDYGVRFLYKIVKWTSEWIIGYLYWKQKSWKAYIRINKFFVDFTWQCWMIFSGKAQDVC